MSFDGEVLVDGIDGVDPKVYGSGYIALSGCLLMRHMGAFMEL